jgi:hypothetical protein
MKHFIYKTTHTNGKYYIGRHSTDNIDDGYIGSGRWPRSIKDKSSLTREILEYTDSEESLIALEQQYLTEHFGKPDCMNMSNTSTGAPVGDANPMKNPETVDKFKGENHWTTRYPESVEILRKKQNDLVSQGKHVFQGDSNPNIDGRNAKAAMTNGNHISIKDNPSICRSREGVHHWQHGKSPNYDGKLNKKLIAEGRHNFLGPELNQKRIAEGTHNFLGSDSNQRRLAAGTHPSQQKQVCEHCGKTASISMYTRWHGENCKQKETL